MKYSLKGTKKNHRFFCRSSIYHLLILNTFVLMIVSVMSMIYLSDRPCLREEAEERRGTFSSSIRYNEPSSSSFGIEQCANFKCSSDPKCLTNDPNCCVSILKNSLTFVDFFFRKHKLNYVVIYGTLLGAVRNGTIIPWTQDIDLGYFNRSFFFRQTIRDELYQHGYHVFETLRLTRFCIHKDAAKRLVPYSMLILSEPPKEIQQIQAYVDLYFAWRKSNNDKASLFALEFSGLHLSSISFRSKVKIDGKSYPTVDNVHEHLIYFYGKEYLREIIPKELKQ